MPARMPHLIDIRKGRPSKWLDSGSATGITPPKAIPPMAGLKDFSLYGERVLPSPNQSLAAGKKNCGLCLDEIPRAI